MHYDGQQENEAAGEPEMLREFHIALASGDCIAWPGSARKASDAAVRKYLRGALEGLLDQFERALGALAKLVL
jgi:hypothetical protein